MRNRTCENTAEAIIANGCGRELIIQALKAVYDQGYVRGYTTKTSDIKKVKTAKHNAMDKSFKKELDMIDDVTKAKWQ